MNNPPPLPATTISSSTNNSANSTPTIITTTTPTPAEEELNQRNSQQQPPSESTLSAATNGIINPIISNDSDVEMDYIENQQSNEEENCEDGDEMSSCLPHTKTSSTDNCPLDTTSSSNGFTNGFTKHEESLDVVEEMGKCSTFDCKVN